MKIQDIIDKYHNEWILVNVEKINEINQPVEGQLILHSKNRDDIYKKMKSVKGHTYTMFTGKVPEKGYAVVF